MAASVEVLTAYIVVVSDTAFAEPGTDKSGPVLRELLESQHWHVEGPAIVPDDIDRIREAVRWSAEEKRSNLCITTGGTGFAQKDVTPEAVWPLLYKTAPGLVHGMLNASLQVTPFAMMSRPVAGVCRNTLVITLPGSPKGAKENLESILKLLPHACMQAAGADSRKLHSGGVKALEREAGFIHAIAPAPPHDAPKDEPHDTHHHHHHQYHGGGGGGHVVPIPHTKAEDRPLSNDPRAGAAQRNRESPYPMLAVEQALSLILDKTPLPRTVSKRVDSDLVGYVLAEDVTASDPVPAFRASIVDGYAIVLPEDGKKGGSKGVFPVVSISHAAPAEVPALKKGQVVRITTGAPLPPHASAVVMVEDTVVKKSTEDGREEREIEILTNDVKPGENVREVGSDIAAGSTILQKGDKVGGGGGELGLLASVGRGLVKVYDRPAVGVMSTGDEIVPHDRPGHLVSGEVRDCNRPVLMATLKGWGYPARDMGIAPDKPDDLEAFLRRALREVDVLVTSGGVSMGELDLLKPTIERAFGGTIHFGRVSMKPGKPTTFATVQTKANRGDPQTKLIFSLPGNPASAGVTASLFVLPSLMAWSGGGRTGGQGSPNSTKVGLPMVKVELLIDITCDLKREEYVRAVVTCDGKGHLGAVTTGGQRSSRVGSLKGANALLIMPAGGGKVAAGETISALLMEPVSQA